MSDAFFLVDSILCCSCWFRDLELGTTPTPADHDELESSSTPVEGSSLQASFRHLVRRARIAKRQHAATRSPRHASRHDHAALVTDLPDPSGDHASSIVVELPSSPVHSRPEESLPLLHSPSSPASDGTRPHDHEHEHKHVARAVRHLVVHVSM